MYMKQIRVTPVLDTAALADDDTICQLTTIPNVTSTSSGVVLLHSYAIIDKGSSAADMEVFFFNGVVTLAANNAAFTVSDADMAAYYTGSILVQMAGYSYGAGVVVQPGSPLLPMQTAKDNPNLYMALKLTKDAGVTFGAANALTFIFTFEVY